MSHKDEPVYICPKCGDIYIDAYTQKARENEKCEYCNYPLKDQIKTNYVGDIYNKMDEQQTKEWEQMLRKRYVLSPNNPHYDEKSYFEREDSDFEFELEEKEWEKKRNAEAVQSTQTVCPKCGSTSFTPVRRKWSFLTGFMTNKVDMVCNNCGCIVKKG